MFCFCIDNVQKREFKRKEQEKFNTFCNNLEKEYNILSEYATERQQEFEKFIETKISNNSDIIEHDIVLFDFKINSLIKIEKDYNELMSENLKLENEDVYNHINEGKKDINNFQPQQSKLTHISSGSSVVSQQSYPTPKDWLELNDTHHIKLKLPINELGEISFMANKSNTHSLDSTIS